MYEEFLTRNVLNDRSFLAFLWGNFCEISDKKIKLSAENIIMGYYLQRLDREIKNKHLIKKSAVGMAKLHELKNELIPHPPTLQICSCVTFSLF